MGILNIMKVYHEVVEFTQLYNSKHKLGEDAVDDADSEGIRPYA